MKFKVLVVGIAFVISSLLVSVKHSVDTERAVKVVKLINQYDPKLEHSLSKQLIVIASKGVISSWEFNGVLCDQEFMCTLSDQFGFYTNQNLFSHRLQIIANTISNNPTGHFR
jgi:hypothetical protein